MTPEEFRFNFAPVGSDHYPFLREFDAMIEAVRQEEREWCASIADSEGCDTSSDSGYACGTAGRIAAAIRALGDE